MEKEVISRRDFIKKGCIGLLGLLAFIKFGSSPVVNIGSDEGNVIQSNTAPTDHSKMWLNTGSGLNTYGINKRAVPSGALCYFDNINNGWKPTTTTWA